MTNEQILERKKKKALYDKEYRQKNAEKLKKNKSEWFNKDYALHPEKYREKRKEKMKAHVEYCRQDSYRKKKKEYDRVYLAKKNHGEFWESSILLFQLESQIDRYEANITNNTYNKSQKRKKRLWTQPIN